MASNLITSQKHVHIGDVAPDFVAKTTQGTIDWHKYIDGKWAILFSHPAAFTPVCTTELGQVSRLQPEFEKRGTLVVGLSVDTVEHNTKWIDDINEVAKTKLTFPIICDDDFQVSLKYGMLNQDHIINGKYVTARTVFFIGPDKKVRATLTYPASSGRNFNEILRLLDSLQTTEKSIVATPVDWKKGEDVIVVPSVPTEEAIKQFPDLKIVKPYLRYTQP